MSFPACSVIAWKVALLPELCRLWMIACTTFSASTKRIAKTTARKLALSNFLAESSGGIPGNHTLSWQPVSWQSSGRSCFRSCLRPIGFQVAVSRPVPAGYKARVVHDMQFFCAWYLAKHTATDRDRARATCAYCLAEFQRLCNSDSAI